MTAEMRGPIRIPHGTTYRDAELPTGTCADGKHDPDMWTLPSGGDSLTVQERQERRHDNDEAIRLCLTECPIREWCAARPVNPGTIQGGIPTQFNEKRKRGGQQERADACGTPAGVNRHRRAGEKPCQRCLAAKNRARAQRNAQRGAAA